MVYACCSGPGNTFVRSVRIRHNPGRRFDTRGWAVARCFNSASCPTPLKGGLQCTRQRPEGWKKETRPAFCFLRLTHWLTVHLFASVPRCPPAKVERGPAGSTSFRMSNPHQPR